MKERMGNVVLAWQWNDIQWNDMQWNDMHCNCKAKCACKDESTDKLT